MQKLTKQTLDNIRDQLASFTWSDEELNELADPKLGIITGFQDLLHDLDQLRLVDLKDIAPAGPVTKSGNG
jgi:hypothetical protein